MWFARLVRSTLVGLLLVGLAGCATDKPSGGGVFKVGNPYQINGVWYYPKEDPFYDETGVASWYGRDFHGKSTANGERYDMDALTARRTCLRHISRGRDCCCRHCRHRPISAPLSRV